MIKAEHELQSEIFNQRQRHSLQPTFSNDNENILSAVKAKPTNAHSIRRNEKHFKNVQFHELNETAQRHENQWTISAVCVLHDGAESLSRSGFLICGSTQVLSTSRRKPKGEKGRGGEKEPQIELLSRKSLCVALLPAERLSRASVGGTDSASNYGEREKCAKLNSSSEIRDVWRHRSETIRIAAIKI